MKLHILHPLFALLATVAAAFAEPVGTAFTIQGRLDLNGAPADGAFDLQFDLFDVADDGAPVAAPVVLPGHPIRNGVFSADLDFGGSERFDGTAYWVGITVTDGGVANVVNDRIALRATPYALRSLGVAAGSVRAESIADGAVTAAKLAPGSVGFEQFNVAGAPGAGQVLGYDGGGLAWTAPGGGGGGGPWLLNGTAAYYNAGSVGIGTSAPSSKLHVETNWDGDLGANIFLSGSKPSILWSQRALGGIRRHWLAHMDTDGNFGFYHRSTMLGPPAADSGWLLKFHLNAETGDFSYAGKLSKLDTAEAFGATVRSADLLLGHSARRGSPGRALVDWNDGQGTRALVVNWANDWPETHIGGAVTQVTTLRITGGADLAEPFAFSGGDVPPGSVVVIDESNPGRLKLSSAAYDKKVAGIVSGADGIQPGISMTQVGQLEPGRNVALSGRVHVKANTSAGSIVPGDLLTTSATPGEAMKATDRDQAQGAILGKAMAGLENGSGTVLVLVTLQ